MENNDLVQEEIQEQNTAPDAEQVENQEGQEETRDWKAEALKYKAIAERKDKKLQEKSEATSDNTLKTNTEQNAPTIEHMAILAKDPNVEKLKFAEKWAKTEGISLTEAYQSPVAQAKFQEMDRQAQIKANSLDASTGSAPAPRAKTPSNMTDEEHKAWAQEKLAGAVNK